LIAADRAIAPDFRQIDSRTLLPNQV